MISFTFAIAFAVRFRGALLVPVVGVVVVDAIGAILLRDAITDYTKAVQTL
jgi:hypothetical protein